jgi:hypothetical protein
MVGEAAKRSLIEHFAALENPRQAWKVIYPLPESMLQVLCVTLAGGGFRRGPALGREEPRFPAAVPALRARRYLARHPQ